MKTCRIANAQLVLPSRVVSGSLDVRDGRIAQIQESGSAQPQAPFEGPVLDARNGFVVPGFIDSHLHGGGGVFVSEEGTADAVRAAVKAHRSHGTTTLYLTTGTMRPDQEKTFLQVFAEARRDPDLADSLPGVHMEGPFLSRDKAGAHALHLLRPASLKELDQWQEWSQNAVRLVTVAVEADPGLSFMKEATRRGVRVLLGHTDCSYEQALQAFRAGANRVTHLFNAMSAFHHRKPGVPGAALSDDEAWVELIADGHHVHPAVMTVIVRSKPKNRILVVTDCISDYDPRRQDQVRFGGVQVRYDARGYYVLENGTMCGSALTMEKAVANIQSMTGLSLPEAVNCVTLNPAVNMGLDDRKGSLAVGKDADLVVLDAEWTVQRTLIKGRTVFEQGS